MKKIFALLLSALLVFACACALAEGPLTVDELTGFWDQLLQTALEQGDGVVSREEGDALWSHDYGDILLYSADETLTETSPIDSCELIGGIELPSDMRGVAIGSAAQEVLASYPLDNPALSGTYEQAALYISGQLPDTVYTGTLLRNGTELLLIEYDIYTPVDGEVEQCYITYTLDQGKVDGIVSGVLRRAEAEVREELEEVSALQESRAYTPYAAPEAPEALAREDLLFVNGAGTLDFVSASAEDLIALMGEPEVDTWEEAEGGYARLLDWNSVNALMIYDSQKQNGVLAELNVYGPQLEGPRGLHIDDTVESVLARFVDGVTEEDPSSGGAWYTYTVALDDQTVALQALIVDDSLWIITCAYQ